MIPKDKVQEILEASRIEEVVGEFVSLKKRGANLLGVCPFHNEKTPSFTVSPAKGIFKCFGCGESGNSVGFIMKHEHYSFPEALRWLASKYNIEVEEEERSPEELKAMDERESMYNLSVFAQKFFSEQLNQSDEGKSIAYSYLRERGISDSAINTFQLGYCPNKFDDFTNHAIQHGYKKSFLLSTGLSSEKNDRLFDKFRGRILFPIHNISGRVIGFGGRILSKEKNRPKYLNSPESAIYHKSNVLYGIFQSKNEISKLDNCYLVEGYTDVISLHMAGVKNVVASSGTSLTSGQIRLIHRYTPNITILYDGDNAGIKASFRGIDLILEQGMNVKVVLFPEGDDPDSFARSNPSSVTKKYIEENAKDFIHFKISVLKEEAGNDPIKRTGLIRQILDSIALIPDLISRQVYVKQCSNLLDFEEDVLFRELNKILDKKTEKEYREQQIKAKSTASDAKPKVVEINSSSLLIHEMNAIRLLIRYGDRVIKVMQLDEYDHELEIEISMLQYFINDIMAYEINFSNANYLKIINEFVNCIEKEFIPNETYFIHHEDDDIRKTAIDLIAEKEILLSGWEKKGITVTMESDNLKKTVDRFMLSYRAYQLKDEISRLTDLLRENPENIMEILTALKEKKEEYTTVNSELGRVIN